jgi:hypothetical protein
MGDVSTGPGPVEKTSGAWSQPPRNAAVGDFPAARPPPRDEKTRGEPQAVIGLACCYLKRGDFSGGKEPVQANNVFRRAEQKGLSKHSSS